MHSHSSKMRTLFSLVILVAIYFKADAFSLSNVRSRHTYLGMNLNNAAAALVRKGKMKDVKILLDDVAAKGDEHPINKYLKEGTRAFGVEKPYNLLDAITGRYSSLAILPEYSKKAKTGFIIGMPPPEIMGGVLRDAGSRGIVVSLDKRNGGSTAEEFARFTREQSRARLFMPGPIPVIWNDVIVDDIQILQAAACGAAAIVLCSDWTDNLAGQVKLAREHLIEPIVLVKNLEESNAALAAGVKCLCMHNLEEAALVELRKQLPDTPGLYYGARLRPDSDFTAYTEIDLCWVLRDNKFNFIWPSPEAIFTTGMSDIYPTVLAMRSKASRQFLSPRQFLMDRKREGAKEYLGDILY